MSYTDNVKVCRNCRKMFNSLFGKQLCPACEEKMEDDLVKVKNYLWENKGASIAEVAKQCDVNQNQIRQWLNDERIQLAEGSVIEMFCETCGSLISKGRFCEKCKAKTQQEFASTAAAMAPKPQMPQKPDKENPKMRFLSN